MEKQGERCALPRDSPPLQRGQDQVEIRYQRVQDAAEARVPGHDSEGTGGAFLAKIRFVY